MIGKNLLVADEEPGQTLGARPRDVRGLAPAVAG
eukprot:CAMPEP_0175456454 /NCGR_PEP_ID=MMETSP0095-20121207/65550_1 /TAXON_ID=311494 /ORGANISM="Alexandrium monilatum, Strain CCMP3105" /LENGTH=33 /DNA_ID= /DNA_START= /DNA_END= /DNA_ORIENTATION=